MSRWVLVIAIVCLSIYSIFNAKRLEVETIDFQGPVSMDIAHISDLHLGSTSKGHLKRVVTKINEIGPDVVFMVHPVNA